MNIFYEDKMKITDEIDILDEATLDLINAVIENGGKAIEQKRMQEIAEAMYRAFFLKDLN